MGLKKGRGRKKEVEDKMGKRVSAIPKTHVLKKRSALACF